jgi:hypothetical protein
VPVDVLGSLRRPAAEVLADDEGRLALISDTISGLLGLVDHASDPVKDPAHILLSQVLDAAWRNGDDPDLEHLLLRLVDPPFPKVGVFPVDTFFPPKQRMALAMKLNGVIASPTFQSWTRGASLDPAALLAPAGDRTRVSVFCLAHLSDGERQFFLALLLGRLLAWSRTQPGTERLRAVLFFDEVAGYLPPHPADPPTKRPLLTLMKQARAMGLGVVLATQNPVDVDYKALSNAGLWAIGRLRTAQDRERVLAGIPGANLGDAIAGLEKRQFLITQASGATQVVGSRQAMCWLRGPFTRSEISQFKATSLHADPPGAPRAAAPKPVAASSASAPDPKPVPAAARPAPKGPPADLPQRFLDPAAVFAVRMDGRFTPWAEPAHPDGTIRLRPALHAQLRWTFDQASAGFFEVVEQHRVWFPLGDVRPDEHHVLRLSADDLSSSPPDGAVFDPVPEWMDEKRELDALAKRVAEEVWQTETTGQLTCRPLKLVSKSGETEAAFRARCEAAADDVADDAIAALKDKVEAKADKLEDRIRAQDAKLREALGNLSARRAEEAVNVGETLLSWFTGRKKSVSTAATKRRMSSSASEKVDQTEAALDALKDELAELEQSVADEIEALRAKHREAAAEIERKEIRLKRSDVTVESLTVLWIPVTRRL